MSYGFIQSQRSAVIDYIMCLNGGYSFIANLLYVIAPPDKLDISVDLNSYKTQVPQWALWV